MALDRSSKVFAWGDGTFGCLGFGDNKRRSIPQVLPFFDNPRRKVIDVSCGDQFTVVIALVEEPIEVIEKEDAIGKISTNNI